MWYHSHVEKKSKYMIMYYMHMVTKGYMRSTAFNSKGTPTNNSDCNCHTKAVECVPTVWVHLMPITPLIFNGLGNFDASHSHKTSLSVGFFVANQVQIHKIYMLWRNSVT